MRALRPIHKHAQTSQVSTVTKWEIAGYAGMLEGNAAPALPVARARSARRFLGRACTFCSVVLGRSSVGARSVGRRWADRPTELLGE